MGGLSRRRFLLGFPAVQVGRAAGKGQQFPSEARRFLDPLTEREIWRLTPLSSANYLPDAHHRYASHSNTFLLHAGRRRDETYAFRMELPTGRSTGRSSQLTEGPGLFGLSLCLAPDERSFFYLQDRSLKQMGLRALREREIFRVEDGWRLTGDLSLSIDGRFAALVESRDPVYRIRVVETLKGKHWLVAEEKSRLARPRVRPKRDQVLYTQTDPWRLWLVNLLDGKQRQAVRPRQEGEEIGSEYWTGDGKLIGYVHYADRKSSVRTYNPDTREEIVLARCTQFGGAMGNADNSAIVGECRSQASPNIYVLFPALSREVTVSEHASSRSAPEVEPRPAFSPDSQWIYYTSDREKTAVIYRAGVADWVEKT
jgi:Tol biopolymer transport system component